MFWSYFWKQILKQLSLSSFTGACAVMDQGEWKIQEFPVIGTEHISIQVKSS